jgi:hypothetical protein
MFAHMRSFISGFSPVMQVYIERNPRLLIMCPRNVFAFINNESILWLIIDYVRMC